jgi:molybdopterin-synthase adenylyltransferase
VQFKLKNRGKFVYVLIMKKNVNIERHKRHILLREIGGHGQKLLANSCVAIVGMGGLGAPCALYLAAAGVGKLILIDDDIVDISNLQRQIIYKTNDINKPKVECAKFALNALDENIEIIIHNIRLNKENAAQILENADIIIDGTDNFKTRFLINEIAFSLGKILVSGALGRFDGQIMAFDFTNKSGPCYQCLVPEMPIQEENCDFLGVVGAICGIVGTIMALETIKIIVKAGNSLIGRILIYDGLGAKSRTISQSQDTKCKICSNT